LIAGCCVCAAFKERKAFLLEKVTLFLRRGKPYKSVPLITGHAHERALQPAYSVLEDIILVSIHIPVPGPRSEAGHPAFNHVRSKPQPLQTASKARRRRTLRTTLLIMTQTSLVCVPPHTLDQPVLLVITHTTHNVVKKREAWKNATQSNSYTRARTHETQRITKAHAADKVLVCPRRAAPAHWCGGPQRTEGAGKGGQGQPRCHCPESPASQPKQCVVCEKKRDSRGARGSQKGRRKGGYKGTGIKGVGVGSYIHKRQWNQRCFGRKRNFLFGGGKRGGDKFRGRAVA
jgi:hypothetical protein